MREYDVVIEVRVSAENRSEAIEKAFEVLNSPNIKDVKVEVFEKRTINELMKGYDERVLGVKEEEVLENARD